MRIRGLCDYPSIGPLIDGGHVKPILMVKLHQTEIENFAVQPVAGQLAHLIHIRVTFHHHPVFLEESKLQFHMTAKTED